MAKEKNIEELFNNLLSDKEEKRIMNLIINESDMDVIIKKLIKEIK